MSHSSQFGLLAQRRFAPFFWTQFCGAANDNLFKFSFTVMATWQLGAAWLPPDMAGLVIGAVFILPFLLLLATSGQLADKFDKRALIVWIKRLEVAVMLLAAVGFWRHDAALLLGTSSLPLYIPLFPHRADFFRRNNEMIQKRDINQCQSLFQTTCECNV